MPYRRRFGRRFIRSRRPKFSRVGRGRRMLRGRRFSRVRRGRGKRTSIRRSRKSRTRRASRSTRSSGNIGYDYRRLSRQVLFSSANNFPFLSVPDSGRLCIAWSLSNAIPKGQFISTIDGTISGPTALVPAVTQTPLDYTLSGYLSFCLADFPKANGDVDFNSYGYYRIRKITYTIRDRRSDYVATLGNTVPGGIGVCPEVQLVNTSKTGQFVMPYELANVGGVTNQMEDVFNQVLNWPSSRNISKRRFWRAGRNNVLSMTIDPTEDYVHDDQSNRVRQISGAANPSSLLNGYEPAQFWDSPAVTADIDAGRTVKRRRFRWTNMWSRARSGNNYVVVLRDDKLAHGVQINVRRGTYTAQTLPYMSTSVSMQVEFRQRHGCSTGTMPTALTTSVYLFPFTYAGANSN